MLKASSPVFEPEQSNEGGGARKVAPPGRAERSSASIDHEDSYSLAASLAARGTLRCTPSSEVARRSLEGEAYEDGRAAEFYHQELHFREVCRGFCIRDW
jgi:hypothetical protein